MPTAATLERFIARVETNAHPVAREDSSIEDFAMRETRAAPRVPRRTGAAS